MLWILHTACVREVIFMMNSVSCIAKTSWKSDVYLCFACSIVKWACGQNICCRNECQQLLADKKKRGGGAGINAGTLQRAFLSFCLNQSLYISHMVDPSLWPCLRLVWDSTCMLVLPRGTASPLLLLLLQLIAFVDIFMHTRHAKLFHLVSCLWNLLFLLPVLFLFPAQDRM